MGHEFTGTVVEAGAAVKTLKVGDKVVSPFTASWWVPPYPDIRLGRTREQIGPKHGRTKKGGGFNIS